jgi:hypothetical protein
MAIRKLAQAALHESGDLAVLTKWNNGTTKRS